MGSFRMCLVNREHYGCSGNLDTDTWESYVWGGERKTETWEISKPQEVERNVTDTSDRKDRQVDISMDEWMDEHMGGWTNSFMLMTESALFLIFQVTKEYSPRCSSLLL